MSKTLAYRLFGVGKIPDQFKTQLEREDVFLQDEGIAVSATYKNFRRPGAYSSWRREWHSGSLTMTHTRLVGMAGSSLLVNVPFTDVRLQRIAMSLERPDALLFAFNASLFHTDWSGGIEYRFRTPQAQAFLEAVMARMTQAMR